MKILNWLGRGEKRRQKSRAASERRRAFRLEILEPRVLMSVVPIISEVPPADSGDGAYAADCLEVTNTDGSALNIADWQIYDNSNGSPETAKAALSGETSTPEETTSLASPQVQDFTSLVDTDSEIVDQISDLDPGVDQLNLIQPAYTLQLLHYYGESGLLGVETAPVMGALIDKFDDQFANTLVIGEGDSYIPGPWLVGGADPSLNGVPGIGSTALGRPDIAIMNAFGTDASALGNHEFDLGSPVLQGAIGASGAWVGAQFPLITANLDFSADSFLRGLADATIGGTATNAFAGKEASTIKGKIAPYAVVTQGGEMIGLVGATTYDLLIKSSPNGTVPKDDGNLATDDLEEVAIYIQAAVDALEALGVNKIVMVDQLDTIERNKLLAPLVDGIDVMIAGGGHERMGDATDTPVGFNGHSADFISDVYPIATAGSDGKPTLIVTTDTEYTYLGRLVVDFDASGEIILSNLDMTLNGAYASTEANLQAAYGTSQSAAQIVAGSTIGAQVNAIAQAINSVIASKDGNVFGYTNVYLEGDRAFGRAQEVNLGDISADANLFKAKEALGAGAVLGSLKNGGGIRASIGSIDEDGDKLPPIGSSVKPANAVSQLDIENALRFDNRLMVFDTTPQGLLNILNFAAGLPAGNGGFPQIGGIRYSYDPSKPAGQKVRDVAIYDLDDDLVAKVADNGVLLAGAPTTISVAVLNFTANGGDGYPIKANADNFRFLLNDGTLSAPVDEALDFTAAANVPANALGEQKALQDFLQAFHATPPTAYDVADTPAAQDQRIQNLSQKADTVFPGVDLSAYVRVGRFDLPEPTRTTPPANSLLAQEVSAVTYNWDTDTLFVVGDGGTSVVQVTKTGQLVDSMTLAPGGSPQGTEFFDPEGLTYVGNGQFVMAEERDRQAVLLIYAAGTTLTRSQAQTVDLGTFVPNIGIEGISFDPQTSGFIAVKEIDPQGIFQTGIDFAAGTATNGSPTTENSTNLFDPALANLLDFADVFALSNLPYLIGEADFSHLLALSQESGKIVNIDRSGNISSSLTIVSDPGNPLSVSAQQHEGLTMDRSGFLYVVSENGGGDFDHPQLWVYAPATVPNQAPTAVALNNQVNTIVENTSITARVKIADVAITDDGQGTNNLTVTGTDADFFEVDSNGLFIKAGTVLDFETKSSYSVSVNVDDPTLGITPDAFTPFSLTVTDVINEDPAHPLVFISEVAPWSSGNSPVSADWFEVTNNGFSAANIAGWKMDDSSGSFAAAVALNGITSIAPGESVVFIESANLASVATTFRNTWFGANPPAGLQIGSYSGGGVGLSTGGDAVNLYNSSGVLQASVSFGASPGAAPFATFSNAAGLNDTAISELSAVGVNGAFVAVNDADEIGSPGTVGKLFISEVAPWSSGNSPVGADWFEVTNTKSHAMDITGWKVDDSSGSPAAAVALSGITNIAPGESVIFIETADLASATTVFLTTWFGANSPAGLRIGSYSGGGVGLSTGGDAVNLYNGGGVLQASVTFGPSSAGPFPTFDNGAGLNNATISQLSAVGVNGAFVAANDASEIGSPGTINNHTPVAGTDIVTTTEDAAVTFNVLTNDTDANGDTLAITSFTAAGNGALVSNGNGSFTYTPALNFNGSDSFTYTISDGRGGTAEATVSITVNAVNDAPVAVNDSYATNEDVALNIAAAGALASDTDADDNALTAILVSGVSHGTLTLNANGSFRYSPAANFSGTDSFTYRANDGTANSNLATVTITVNAVNDAPVLSVPGAQTTVEDIAVTVTGIAVADVDVNEGTGAMKVNLSVSSGKLTIATGAAGGLSAAQIAGNGTGAVVLQGPVAAVNATLAVGVKYLANLNFHGTDTLSITVNDLGNTGASGALTDSRLVSIRVLSPAEQIGGLRSLVNALYGVGMTNQGQTNSLLKKLDHALSALDRYQTKVAYNMIGAFKNEVSGLLKPTRGEALLTAANLLLQSLQIGGGKEVV